MRYPRGFGEDGVDRREYSKEIFVVGDVVYMKCGSPPMSVMAITTEGRVQTAWQNYYGDFMCKEFPSGVLTKEPPPLPPEAHEGDPDGEYGDCA